MPAFKSRIESALSQRKEQGLDRSMNLVFAGNQSVLEHAGKRYINFSSNDYLGLANDQSLVRAWQQGLSVYGSGSGASPMVTGFSAAHSNLEAALTEWLGYERAILFGSGFSANQALLFTLLEKSDVLLQDRLNHASLMEAGALSPAKMKRFKHNDLEHLRSLINTECNHLVVTEGVFSMDGDCSPLAALAQITQENDAWLAVDDAHGIGVLGDTGGGSCEKANIKPDILVVTFGKAFGVSGAAILCDRVTGDFLTQFARHHVYSTAMPPAQAYALTHAVSIVQEQGWRREKLAELSAYYQECLHDMSGFIETLTPIKPFVIGDAEKALSVADSCRQHGFWVTAIRPPTVPAGTSRLRITLTANHTKDQIKTLSHVLEQALGAR
ncbi:8-amino-7-oxononanoate synthase [Vibrio natriegens]|uniref:8-amino-7-oxononanoate synthase n=1 Tax=Vibrio natriegens NBRC 15636 = ATCC 14048 = DSM 759 TaxID=1219067 RepID=A0AAN0Y199_VIBNA|nr:8-amino-7-oxononanoate synthase [Vibrio natriegens]ALR15917.1 8-amino-7-oxononanoate synthase [Vibrio natriegens NBRC 15636 = ATCC 14048 = DSM 759]ANQ12222.1 8-amino-7-oxononanoate synthase [Vibrio natriegens NBRC 15636 = ATCC 14048 = DSM 759]EPM42704.1 8-amino-7-oxononanoate synthase [Vibrio natriegens NBRC 15636 = ATCC 14048 = DSM 759]MDX6026594.1 8-amino-7-oxononanoate synthase [Vibrio natriegens NBRC 15636 = ATCC 14048 = DSM 759]UUI12686.1 8-amino-7-oxononanoate synthase [Vibrio natrieg